MKKILFAVIMAGLCASARAVTGSLVYEAAASSVTVAVVSLSSSTPTLISKAATTTVPAGQLPISWYSITLFNVDASCAAYAFSGSSATGPVPALTCANGIPIGAGTPLAPWHQTEQFFGFFVWGIGCATNADISIKAEYRGR